MLNLWSMVKGRIVAALVSAIVAGLALLGVDVAADTELLNTVTGFVVTFIAFLQTAGYAVFHVWMTKRKLQRGEVAEENIDSLRAR